MAIVSALGVLVLESNQATLTAFALATVDANLHAPLVRFASWVILLLRRAIAASDHRLLVDVRECERGGRQERE